MPRCKHHEQLAPMTGHTKGLDVVAKEVSGMEMEKAKEAY